MNSLHHPKQLRTAWASKVIELFAANTPNGKKVSIMLEEIGYDYKVTKIDLDKGEQFNSDFKKLNPLSKIPVIIDHKKMRLFLSLVQY